MKYSSLEAFRGLAAIVVFFHHSTFTNGEQFFLFSKGSIFVDFFFVLSGFIMAFAYVEKIQNGTTFNTFIILRLGRLYPLHFLMLILWVGFITVKLYGYHKYGLGSSDPLLTNTINVLISNLFLTNSLGLHETAGWNYPAWSISTEFWVYMLFFLFTFCFGKNLKVYMLVLVSLFSYFLLWAMTDKDLLRTIDLGLLRCVGGFFLGMFVYYLSKFKFKFVFFGAITNSFVEFITVFIVMILIYMSTDSNMFQLLTILSFGLVIYVFSIQESGVISKLLKMPVFQFMGKLSYSIYMSHAIFLAVAGSIYFSILKLPAVYIDNPNGHPPKILFDSEYGDLINIFILLLIICFSYCTYRFVEQPWRNKFRNLAYKTN